MENSLKEFRKNNEDNLDKSQDYFENQLSFISAGWRWIDFNNQFVIHPAYHKEIEFVYVFALSAKFEF